MIAEETKQRLQLLDGTYDPAQASEVVRKFIDEEINFYKLLKLKNWMGDQECDTCDLDEKIGSLNIQKQQLQHFINQARLMGRPVSLKGKLEIEIAD